MADQGSVPPQVDGVASQLVMRELEYAPLPWQTHPIDTVQQQQGWGPFKGPWSPFNFPDPAMSMAGGGINTYWSQGDNTWLFGPGYLDYTVMTDNSMSFVNNNNAPVFGSNSVPAVQSSTISQGVAAPQATTVTQSLGTLIKKWLGIN